MVMQRLKNDNLSLHERICNSIKEYIVEQKLKPGDRLPSENELTGMLGVSRTSLREAITSLQALGIVEIQMGRGAFVREFNMQTITNNLAYGLQFKQSDLLELAEIRRLLEVYAIKNIALSITEEHLWQLRHTVDAMADKAATSSDFIEEDIRFHRLISEASGKHVLGYLLDSFWQLQFKARHIEDDMIVLQNRCLEHKNIYTALERHDRRGAIYFMQVHFDNLIQRLADK